MSYTTTALLDFLMSNEYEEGTISTILEMFSSEQFMQMKFNAEEEKRAWARASES